ncbi:hypothetical protein [Kosakonia sp. YIM B13611]|uniref:hypothetical protein n=1 Tax=unclassified Kosakonia TaxID=2632876 RepID=UPI0036A2F066
MGDNSASVIAAAQAGKTTAENNVLSTNQLSGFAERARICQGASCEAVIRDMITLNAEQQVDIATLCTTAPKQCKEKFGYLVEQWPAFDAMIKHMAADGTLPDDFRDALTPMYAQGIEAQGILANSGWTERFEAMGANKEVAQAMAATLPLLIGGAKGARGSKNPTTGNSSATPEVTTPGGVGATVNSAKPVWLQDLQAGNKFNLEQYKNYPYKELYVNKPNGNGYYRLDSYNPTTGEIVSRKFTQFADIKEATATSYIREAVNKYPVGATIAKVLSSGALAGDTLRGTNILEVPPQVKPIPQAVLNAADKAGVVIRDTNGKVYQ